MVLDGVAVGAIKEGSVRILQAWRLVSQAPPPLHYHIKKNKTKTKQN